MCRFYIYLAFGIFASLTAMADQTLKHNLREIIAFDSVQMEKLVSKRLDIQESNDEVFFSQAADVLADTALMHPSFSEREAALSRLKSKMDQVEYYEVMRRAADILIALVQKGSLASSAEQASALVALTNWVVEARNLPEEEIRPTLEKIATAEIEISDDARDYGREPLKNLVSPSEEAKLALVKFEKN